MAPSYPTRRAGLGRGLAEIVGAFGDIAPDPDTHPLLVGPDVVPLEAVPVALLLADWTGRVRAVNTRWIELSGLSPADSMGAGWLQALDRLDRPALEAAFSRLDYSPDVQRGEYRWAGRDSRAVWHMASQMTAGEPVVAIAISHLPTPKPKPKPPMPTPTSPPPASWPPELPALLESFDALLLALDRVLAGLPQLQPFSA